MSLLSRIELRLVLIESDADADSIIGQAINYREVGAFGSSNWRELANVRIKNERYFREVSPATVVDETGD